MNVTQVALVKRPYPIDELLELRTSLPIVICPIENVNKHDDITSLFRVPYEAFNNPRRFSCLSKILTCNMNQQNPSQGSKRHIANSFECSEDRASSSIDPKHDPHQCQWNFRRRESSDRSSQPHSAPTGIAAQQSENFQRFYRAVVSPTHVRVTAGGRIVPNTRAAATARQPPQLEWNNDVDHIGQTKMTLGQECNTLCPADWSQNNIMPIMYTTDITNTFVAPHSLPQSSSMPGTASIMPTNVNERRVKSGYELAHGSNTSSVVVQHDTLSQPIKISPPNQFDQSKPFLYNGQIIYPVSQSLQQPHPGSLPIGMTMLGNSSFLPQTQLATGGAFLPTPFSGTTTSIPSPIVFPSRQPPIMLPTLLSSENIPQMIPILPARTMSLSASTLKLQIQNLRNHIKFCDHQLANNKHQIDERVMEANRIAFLHQIKSLETMLNFQVTRETGSSNGSYDRDTRYNDQAISIAPPVAHSTRPNRAENAEQMSAVGVEKKPAEIRIAAQPAESPKDSKQIPYIKPVKKSRLSIKAPAFQPRSQALVQAPLAQQTCLRNEKSHSGVSEFETQAEIEARLLSRSTTDWPSTNASNISTGIPSLSRVRGGNEAATHDVENNQSFSIQRTGILHGPDFATSNSGRLVSTLAVPYLVGTLPHGIHASLAKSADFLYSRPLTEEEVRARYLYWGQAPRSVQSGLPKFDGKDFYPPSPIKKNGRLSAIDHSNGSNVGLGNNNNAILSSEALLAKHGLSMYTTSSPNGTLYSPQSLIPMSHPAHVTGPDGQEMNSSRFTSFTDSGISMAPWSEIYGNNSYTPLTMPAANSDLNTVGLDDFSNLFTRSGKSDCKAPSLHSRISDSAELNLESRGLSAMPLNIDLATKGYSNDETVPLVSRRFKDAKSNVVNVKSELDTSPASTFKNVRSCSSSVEIHLSPQSKNLSPKSAHEKAFVERVENFRSSEQQTLFLQNMMKSASQSPMVGPALSGAITSATARGYLPLYRGSAVASLAPAMLNHANPDRDSQRCLETMKDAGNILNSLTSAVDILSENRPPHLERPQLQAFQGCEDLGAQEYMRYLAQKDDKNKKILRDSLNSEMPTVTFTHGKW